MVGKECIKAESIVDLMRREIPPEPCWIEPGVLPKGGKLLFGGHAKIGKSFVMLQLGADLATGEVPLCCPHFTVPHPVKVLLVEKELATLGLQLRTKTAFTKRNVELLESNFYYSSRESRLRLDTVEGHKAFYELIAEVKPEVLLLDPIGKMHTLDENSNSDISELFDVMDQFLNFGKAWGMSLIFSHHFGKPPKDARFEHDPLDPYNFRGASKWFDDPDTLVTLSRTGNLPVDHLAWRLVSRWTTRQSEPPPDLYFTVNANKDLRVIYERGLVNDLKPRPAAKLPTLRL